MDRDMTPDELRAWTRSFNHRSNVIKRGTYKYGEETKKIYTSDNKKNEDDSVMQMMEEIKRQNHKGTLQIGDMFNMDKEEIERINEQYPSTEEQMDMAAKESPVRRKQ